MTQVVLASRNAKKVAEMQRILRAVLTEVEVVGLDRVTPYDEPAETEPTFEGNARIKAHAAVTATGLPALADDSGICVDALNGMPGVLSARWSGTRSDAANNELLLAQLADVPDSRRQARFCCAVVFTYPVGAAGVVDEVALGEMPGRLLRAPRGDAGFGYDPLFVGDGQDLTNAELSPERKDAISHRARALRGIAPLVADVLGGL